MKNKIALILSFSSALLFSCTKGPEISKTSESKTTETSPSSLEESSSVSSSLSEPSSSLTDVTAKGKQDAFFKSLESVNITIRLSNEALYDLSRYGGDTDTYNHKYDDVYFPGVFIATIGENTYTYNDVGIRMKGATSRRQIADSKGNITNSCHLKVSFKATFDDELYNLSQFSKYKHTWSSSNVREVRKDRRFFGMEKIDFKYLPRNDPATNGKTYSQEIYSYDIFREYDVPAPYARWVNLTIQSEKMSQSFKYEAVECVDKRFLKRVFNEKDGDLYKCTQVIGPSTTGGFGGNTNVKYADFARDGAVSISYDEDGYANGTRIANGKIGVEDNYGEYHPVYSLKTNDSGGENSDFTQMADLINACYSCAEKGAPLSLLESKIDLTEWLNYCAISYVLGNYDDFRNNSNNYYIYFRESDGKAVFIPYDYDYSLGLTKETSVYNHIAKDGPFTSKTSHSTNTISLFKATILTNQNLSYYESGDANQKTMQTSYKNKVKEASNDGVLTYSNYVSFLGTLTDSVTSASDEGNLVSRYMTDKKAVIDGLS